MTDAVKTHAGQSAVIQRCQVHKRRNVLDHLTEEQKPAVTKKLNAAYALEDYSAAKEALNALHRELMDLNPSAARSLAEGLEASRFRGLKPPRFPTVWEGLVNGIVCQQFSLHVGILLLNRLAVLRGLPFGKEAKRHAFPRPEDLATAAPESLRSLGLNGAKTRELIELGGQIASGQLDLESIADLEDAEAMDRLLDLPGVGRWTAEYVLLRGMGRTAMFPGDDVGARNNLARWLRLRKPLDYSRVSRIVDRWRPYGGLIYFHLLLDGLERAGHLQPAIGTPSLKHAVG